MFEWYRNLSPNKQLVVGGVSAVVLCTAVRIAADKLLRPDPSFGVGEQVFVRSDKAASPYFRLAVAFSLIPNEQRMGTITSLTYKGIPPSDGGVYGCEYSFEVKPPEGPSFEACDYQLSRLRSRTELKF